MQGWEILHIKRESQCMACRRSQKIINHIATKFYLEVVLKMVSLLFSEKLNVYSTEMLTFGVKSIRNTDNFMVNVFL